MFDIRVKSSFENLNSQRVVIKCVEVVFLSRLMISYYLTCNFVGTYLNQGIDRQLH